MLGLRLSGLVYIQLKSRQSLTELVSISLLVTSFTMSCVSELELYPTINHQAGS